MVRIVRSTQISFHLLYLFPLHADETEGVASEPCRSTHDAERVVQDAEEDCPQNRLCQSRRQRRLGEVFPQSGELLSLSEGTELDQERYSVVDGELLWRVGGLRQEGRHLLLGAHLQEHEFAAQRRVFQGAPQQLRRQELVHLVKSLTAEEVEAEAALRTPCTSCSLLRRGLRDPGCRQRADLEVRVVAHLLGPTGVDHKLGSFHGNGSLSNVGCQDNLPDAGRCRLEDLILLLGGHLRVERKDAEALHVEVRHEPLLKLVNVAPPWQEDQHCARRLRLLIRLSGLLLLLVHPIDVQDQSLDDGEVEGQAALL
mmetsp:Transcript_54415/g.117775  ORF Transcript_54415/g.117775 Transcript_54415/m.117775 type:complete len:313 (+) Transcript_54415:930-1868(+)